MSKKIPEGVIERLPVYLNCLMELKQDGCVTVSSKRLGEFTEINPAEIRRDLARFGTFGKKGVGYNTDILILKIKHILGSDEHHRIAVVGAGNLGSAIVGYDGFAIHGFSVSAVFDNDATKTGKKIGKLEVSDIKSLKKIIKEKNITIGVIAVPAAEAQNIANLLVEAGVKIVLNYTPVIVTVPDAVKVHNTNPVKELLYTLYYLSGAGNKET
ncbi:redox-sensing transcriptional repressor Rex [Candidatus Oleimmundimicrobium sp.]|uniref:redox-sensing transcriptional repressor Rex n=1 Tax=Candidatus Oleimmundimicrobium sp. TaxID=3060597 RepID=UPI00271FD3FC|nr:redox-sensing transcriptional repressor Rex [Candidatus Oleimmundimicrobium sp.]MDO8886910.1 redox-sensing transcriptional repressor Rex [Candidatus Oleimmundimicrobium sp.]